MLRPDGGQTGPDDFRLSDLGPDGDANYWARTPDVAYHSVTGEYLVVWAGDDNTGSLVDNEFEVYGQRFEATTGAQIGVDLRLSDMGPDGDAAYAGSNPAVTYNPHDNEYLVVWNGYDNAPQLVDGGNEIFGQRLDGATATEIGANDFRLSDMGPDGDPSYAGYMPDVVYKGDVNEYLVVWSGDDNTAPLVDGENEIFGQRIDAATGVEIGDNDFRLSDMGPDGDPSYDAEHPDLAYRAQGNEVLAIWKGDDNTPPLVLNELEIFGQRLRGGGVRIYLPLVLRDGG